MIENIIIEPQRSEFKQLGQRPKKDQNDMEEVIKTIFQEVQSKGDQALISFTEEYDGVTVSEFQVSQEEIEMAIQKVSPSLKSAIQVAKKNISLFHKAQINTGIDIEIMEGVRCMQRSVGIEKVGIYIPGGSAPLFSTVLMLAIPAQLAGCKEIILCTPPDQNGQIHPAIIYAADLCGVSEIYKVGGAQAIAAMTLGTESIPEVYKLFGPGNQYVTAAKQYAQNFGVSMDIPAGPSELLVYANDSSIPSYVAADLLSQAEHGPDSQVILVANKLDVIQRVNDELVKQIQQLPRKSIAAAALKNSLAICISTDELAFEFINAYGPEHLIVASENYNEYIDMITNAGSVFLGNYCPESAGDYASGTNHTLPTDGWSKSCSGVNMDSFCKKITFQEISMSGIQNIGPTVIEMAQNESLDGHAKAVKFRLNQLKR